MCALRATLQSHLNALTCTGISDQESLPPTLDYTGACAGDHGGDSREAKEGEVSMEEGKAMIMRQEEREGQDQKHKLRVLFS